MINRLNFYINHTCNSFYPLNFRTLLNDKSCSLDFTLCLFCQAIGNNFKILEIKTILLACNCKNSLRLSFSQAVANDSSIWQCRQVKGLRFESRQNNELYLPNEMKKAGIRSRRCCLRSVVNEFVDKVCYGMLCNDLLSYSIAFHVMYSMLW